MSNNNKQINKSLPKKREKSITPNEEVEVKDVGMSREMWQNELNKFYNYEPKPFVPGVSPKISLFSTVTLYGKRKTGKSVWMKWFLQYYKQYFPWAWVFTETEQNDHYRTFIPEKFIIEQFNPDVLERIMKRQKTGIKLKKKDPENADDPRAIVIWDDYSGKDIRFNTQLARYYYTGRHFWTLNLFGAQFLHLTPPSIRSNTDLAILFNSDYGDSVEEYWKDFAGKMDKKQFYWMYQKYCGEVDHGFLAIVNDPNVHPSEKFFYGKADVVPVSMDTILGCREYWSGSEKQLETIIDGTLERNIKLIGDMADPDSEVNKDKKSKFEGGEKKEK